MRLFSCCLLVLAALALPAGALGDGDPASDYLIVADSFLPYPPPSAGARAALSAAIDAVHSHHGRVKVAVVATPTDLGSIPSLFGRPADYATFLGQELSFAYSAALLVVMPAGFGFYEGGKPTPSADATLAGLTISDKSAAGLTRSAAEAVTKLAQAGALAYTDTKKPTAQPLVERARSGQPVKLLYRATDDSGRAAVVLTVLDDNVRLALFKLPLRPAVPGALYSVKWRVPASASHRVLAYCARATDASGNRSAVSCAKLTVR